MSDHGTLPGAAGYVPPLTGTRRRALGVVAVRARLGEESEGAPPDTTYACDSASG